MAGLGDLASSYAQNPVLGPANFLINNASAGGGYQQTQLDEQTQALMNALANRAQENPEQLRGNYLSGASSAAGFLPSYSQTYGSDPSMLQAIQNKAQRSFDTNYNNLTRHVKAQIPLDIANRAQKGMQAVTGGQQGAFNNAQGQYQAYSDQQAARSQALASLFGAGGKAAGLAIRNGSGNSPQQNNNGGTDYSQSTGSPRNNRMMQNYGG